MDQHEVVIPKVWRSELTLLLFFFAGCFVSVALTRRFPGSVIRGELFSMFGWRFVVHLPLFWLIPFFTLGVGCFRVYNVRYVLDANGIETRTGILSSLQRTVRVRFEDVRSAETEATIFERFLGIGSVFIGTAAQAGVEIYMAGIAAPEEVQNLVHRERDRRQRLLRAALQGDDQSEVSE